MPGQKLSAQLSGMADDANSAGAKLTGVAKGIYDGWFGSGGTGSAEDVLAAMSAMRDRIIAPYTVATFTSSTASWPRPAGSDFYAILIGGGEPGANGVTDSSSRALGGLGGSYIVQSLDSASLPATLDIEVGSPGARSRVRVGNGAFTGAVLADSGPHGSAGGVADTFGYSTTASAPGNGGGGGHIAGGTVYAGQPGGSTPAAVGGSGGQEGQGGDNGSGIRHGKPGTPGGSVSTGALVKCGGAGGGGGGAGNGGGGFGAKGGNGGNGAAGGFPGGGGGAGGCSHKNDGGAGTNGIGAGGGAGVVWILYR